MRYFPNPLFFLCLLLVLEFCAHASAVPWASDNKFSTSQYRHAAKQSSRKIGNVFPQLTWLRNTAIEKVFGSPPKSSKSRGDGLGALSRSSSSKLPSTLLAKYGGDVVLRFNISTSEEEAALSQAADILFLDVWEFTNNWADIRLREDDVCFWIL
jgi:extracellular matrix protein 14